MKVPCVLLVVWPGEGYKLTTSASSDDDRKSSQDETLPDIHQPWTSGILSLPKYDCGNSCASRSSRLLYQEPRRVFNDCQVNLGVQGRWLLVAEVTCSPNHQRLIIHVLLLSLHAVP